MNYYGHLTVAAWYQPSPLFALGAMLPDFTAMTRLQSPTVNHADVASGVELHHATDAVFHGAPSFLSLNRSGLQSLRARGLKRGAAMGAAHVGVELLLDGAFVSEERDHALYLEAVAAAHADSLARDGNGSGNGSVVEWSDEASSTRWRETCDRLARHGVPHDCRDCTRVAMRIERALGHRPRLELVGEEPARVEEWLREIQGEVVAAAPQVLAEVRAGLTNYRRQ